MTRFMHSGALAVTALILALGIRDAAAQSCTAPTGSQFSVTTLVNTGGTLQESGAYGPVGMSVAPDGKVFIILMSSGQVRVYDPAVPSTTSLAGTIPNYANTEDGALGIVVDPNYATNNWVYTFASDPCGLNCSPATNRAHELARFTYNSSLAAGSRLTNKKVILRVQRATNNNHHAAGGLDFDKNGVLVIGTGDNTNPHDGNNGGYGPIYHPTEIADAQRTAANSNDLRGKVLRIKPLPFPDNQTPAPGIGNTYEIPPGNLWEKINDPAFNPGWRNDSDDIAKVRKEIYAIGARNPYHPRVDTRSGWIFWGDVGPDANPTSTNSRGPGGHDEWNLATSPGFFGHPYCNGYNVPYASLTAPSTSYGNPYDCNATGSASLVKLINKSPRNTGIYHLPRAVPALVAYSSATSSTDDDPRFNETYSTTTINRSVPQETAIGGPMYRYDPDLNSTVKFPPYFEGKVFFFDWYRRNFRVITLDSNGAIPAGAAGVVNFAPTGWPTAGFTDMQFGPDGALYALRQTTNQYSSGTGNGALYKISYTGTYNNACYQPFNVRADLLGPGATQNPVSIRPAIRKTVAAFTADGFLTLPIGYRTAELYDVSGRLMWSHHRAGADAAERIKVPASLGRGVLQARLTP